MSGVDEGGGAFFKKLAINEACLAFLASTFASASSFALSRQPKLVET
jgi:hypothetical protein